MTLRPDGDDCALNLAFVPLLHRDGSTIMTIQFYRAPSHGRHHNEVTADDVGGLSFTGIKGNDQTFSFSFKLSKGDTSYSFTGIKIWPKGDSEPSHAVPLPEPGKEELIYEGKGATFKLEVGVDEGRVTQLRIFNEYLEEGEFHYAFEISDGGKGKLSMSEIDPRIRNNWEPPVDGRRPGCLRGWTAFFRSRR